jgi:BirA family biotin operon repressor/biotin-[acetyl-CoA-carboxylase] ligase
MREELSAISITDGLETRFIGQRVLHYRKLPSTMVAARGEALAGAVEGTVIIAEEQTAGKGRLGRQWLSPRGSIALSVILYPQTSRLTSLIMVASLAVVKAIESVTGLKPQIKWPNDVLIKGKKVCGIIVESGVSGKDKTYAVIGIGINANVETERIGKVMLPATSLFDELGGEVSRLDLVKRLLIEMERLYLLAQDSGVVYCEWRDNLVMLGEKVRASYGDRVYEGVAESVDEDGNLMIRLRDGSLKKFAAGDVTLRGKR